MALWVAYYNFLRPHKHNHYQVLNKVDMLEDADNMPGKWRLLILLGQQTIPPSAGTAGGWLNLFLDSKPEGQNAAIRRDLPLMARQTNATML